ncbi:uncharacterized protein TNCV_3810761 [Trichonephila clavipes]|nr:uncharacterized protein TNCV_3810761 [Trichonephila clavipes]
MTPETRRRNLNQAAPLVPVHPAQIYVGSSNAFLNPSGVCSKDRRASLIDLIRNATCWLVDLGCNVDLPPRGAPCRVDGHIRVSIQPHKSMDPTCQQGTFQAGGGSVMVWGVCSWRDMEPLICLDTTLTGKSPELLQSGTRSKKPKSPEMNINEHISDVLQCAVQKRSPPLFY